MLFDLLASSLPALIYSSFTKVMQACVEFENMYFIRSHTCMQCAQTHSVAFISLLRTKIFIFTNDPIYKCWLLQNAISKTYRNVMYFCG